MQTAGATDSELCTTTLRTLSRYLPTVPFFLEKSRNKFLKSRCGCNVGGGLRNIPSFYHWNFDEQHTIIIVLLHDRIFVTISNDFALFIMYICVIMNLLRKVPRRFKKGKITGFYCKTWSQIQCLNTFKDLYDKVL